MMLTIGFEQQLSVATGGSKLHGLPHSTVLSSEEVRTGGVVSMFVIVWLHVLVLPQQSLATQTRVITCGQTPLVKVPSIETPARQQLSVATGASKLQLEPHSTVRFVGQ